MCSIAPNFTSFQNVINNGSLVDGVPLSWACYGAVRVVFLFGHLLLATWGIVAWMAKNTCDCDFSCCLTRPNAIWVAIRQIHSLVSYLKKKLSSGHLPSLREIATGQAIMLFATKVFKQSKCRVKINGSGLQPPKRN